MIRKVLLPLVLTLGFTLAGTGAQAAGGCGPGFHRGFYGWCRPNLGYRPYAYRPFGGGYRYHYHWGWHRWGGWHRHG